MVDYCRNQEVGGKGKDYVHDFPEGVPVMPIDPAKGLEEEKPKTGWLSFGVGVAGLLCVLAAVGSGLKPWLDPRTGGARRNVPRDLRLPGDPPDGDEKCPDNLSTFRRVGVNDWLRAVRAGKMTKAEFGQLGSLYLKGVQDAYRTEFCVPMCDEPGPDGLARRAVGKMTRGVKRRFDGLMRSADDFEAGVNLLKDFMSVARVRFNPAKVLDNHPLKKVLMKWYKGESLSKGFLQKNCFNHSDIFEE